MPRLPPPEPGTPSARTRPRHLADALLAVVLAVVAVTGLTVSPEEAGFETPDLLAGVLALGQALPLALRRRAPGAVLVAVWLATAAHLLLDYPPQTPVFVGAMVATYSVAAYGRGRAPLAGAMFVTGALTALAVAGMVADPEWGVVDFAAGGLVFVTAWVLGDRARTRRAYTAALEDRARRLEREREAQSRAAVLDERNRMARELHDVVAHGVSVIVVQATAARRVLASDVDAAREALNSIEATGRTALSELRALLGALRSAGEGGELRPQPGLAALPELVERTRETGLPVDLRVEGERPPLPPGVDLSSYRIVQEALTNVLKHAPGACTTVHVRYEADRLRVEIIDEGGGARAGDGAGTGHGLTGMRERATVLGGQLEAGPRPGGGFAVRASFPLRSAT